MLDFCPFDKWAVHVVVISWCSYTEDTWFPNHSEDKIKGQNMQIWHVLGLRSTCYWHDMLLKIYECNDTTLNVTTKCDYSVCTNNQLKCRQIHISIKDMINNYGFCKGSIRYVTMFIFHIKHIKKWNEYMSQWRDWNAYLSVQKVKETYFFIHSFVKGILFVKVEYNQNENRVLVANWRCEDWWDQRFPSSH